MCPRLRFFSRLRNFRLWCRSSSVTVPGCLGPVKPKKCFKKLSHISYKDELLVPKKNTQATGLGRKSCRKGGSRIWSKGPLMGQARAFQNMVFSIIIFNFQPYHFFKYSYKFTSLCLFGDIFILTKWMVNFCNFVSQKCFFIISSKIWQKNFFFKFLVKMNRNKDMVKRRFRSYIVQKYLLKVINWIKHV